MLSLIRQRIVNFAINTSVVALSGVSSVHCTGSLNHASKLALVERPSYESQKCQSGLLRSKHLLVDWPPSERAELEARAKHGAVLVRYDGCSVEVLTQCELPSSYSFTAVTTKTEQEHIRSTADLYAKVPMYAARLEGKLAESKELNLALTIVGRYDLPPTDIRPANLKGAMCDRATHLVTGITTGAFRFYAGAKANAEASLEILSAGVGAKAIGSNEILSADGDPKLCSQRDGQSVPQSGCNASLRIELVPLLMNREPESRAETNHGPASSCANDVKQCEADCSTKQAVISCLFAADGYAKGGSVPKDMFKAAKLYEIACALKNWSSCNTLAWLFEHGDGVAKDETRAVKLYESACGEGFAKACTNLAVTHGRGIGTMQDDGKAAQNFSKACDLGDMRACYHFARHLLHGLGIKQDHTQAINTLEKACSADDQKSCALLALLLLEGQLIKREEKRAFALFSTACAKEIPGACNGLASMYERGTGVDKDLAQALKLHSRACDMAHAPSCNAAGWISEKGPSHLRNKAKSAWLYERGCDSGSLDSCHNYAWLLTHGDGISKDEEKATKLFLKACKTGHAYACNSAAVSYQLGRGVVANEEKAINLFKTACDKKLAIACITLGETLAAKSPSEVNEAQKYYEKACSLGDARGCQLQKK